MIETYQAALHAQIEDLSPGDRLAVAERFVELVRGAAEREDPPVPPPKKTYRVLMSQTAYYHVFVEADSEEEAKARVLDGDYDDSTFIEGENDEVWDVEEA